MKDQGRSDVTYSKPVDPGSRRKSDLVFATAANGSVDVQALFPHAKVRAGSEELLVMLKTTQLVTTWTDSKECTQ